MGERDKIIDSIKELKENHDVVAIKAEFEAEGARKDELIMLREMVYQANLDFIIKIGGCEAIHDLDQCKLLDATGIMAPMIETSFAMKKFKKAAEKVFQNSMENIEWIINAETYTCLNNFDEILSEGTGFLKGVTVGRSDLSASMGIDKSHVESEEVFSSTLLLAKKAKEMGMISNFGGNIGLQSIPFILRMDGFIDRFETRKVVIRYSNNSVKLEKAIRAALNFELDYLKFKKNYYSSMSLEDEERIIRLEKQLKG